MVTDAQSELAVVPDGMSGAADGTLWAADAGGNRAVRIREGGKIVEEVSAGETGVFACALGGDDGKTLFLCIAPDFHEEARSQATEAALLSTKVSVGHGGIP